MFQILGMDLDVGRLPPWIARLPYVARVDAYLKGGADIIPDIDKLANPLEDVQIMFLRRILGLGPSSQHAPLFTETGNTPLRFSSAVPALRGLASRYPHGQCRPSGVVGHVRTYCLGLDRRSGVRAALPAAGR